MYIRAIARIVRTGRKPRNEVAIMSREDHGIAVFANFINHGMPESVASWLDEKLMAETAEIERLIADANRRFASALIKAAPAPLSEIEESMYIASWKAARNTLVSACSHHGQNATDGFCKTCLGRTGDISDRRYNEYLLAKVRRDLNSSTWMSCLPKKEKDSRLNFFTRVFTTLQLRDLI